MSSGGSPSKVESRSTIRPGQEALLDEVTDFLLPRVGQRATEFAGELVAAVPDIFGEGISTFQDIMNQLQGPKTEAIETQLSGVPTATRSPSEVASAFQTGFADPIFRNFQDEIVPGIRESFAGDLFSTEVGEAIGRAGNELTRTVIAPALFGAQETERGREFAAGESAAGRQAEAITTATTTSFADLSSFLTAAGAVQNQEQQRLNAAYREFIRTSEEASPWLQLALQAAGLQTIENIGFQGTEPTDYLALAISGGSQIAAARAGRPQ